MKPRSAVRSVAKQLKELPILFVNPKRYAGLRSSRVRQWYWNAFAAVDYRELKRRRRMVRELAVHSNLPPLPQDSGFAKLEGLDKGLVDRVVTEARQILAETDIPALEAQLGHPHLINVPLRGRLKPGGAIWDFAVNPDLLKLVAEYMGVFPVVQGIHLYYSPNRANLDDTSQFLHLDGQDVKTVKVFLYVEDVTEDNGPLSIISASDSEKLAKSLHYRKAAGERRVQDEVAYATLGRAAVRQLVGEAGTAYVVDTDRCFHFGSREASRPRYVLGFFYFSPFAFVLPMNWRRALPFTKIPDTARLSTRERLLFGVR